jgi:hypothetical protein
MGKLIDNIKNNSRRISLEYIKSKPPKPIFTVYYNYHQAVFMIGFLGFGIRAKNISRAIFTGSMDNVYKIGNWIYVFGRVS